MSRQFKITLLMTVFLLLIYMILRIGFYFYNREFFVDARTIDILLSFIYGMRFDIAAIILLNLPILLLFNLPGKLIEFKWHRNIVFILFCIFNLVGIALNFADYKYFPTIQRRLLYEPYTMLPDILRMIPSLVKEYFVLFMVLIFFAVIFIYFSYQISKKLFNKILSRNGLLIQSIYFIVLIMLMVIGIRGGLQLKPIRQTNAFFSENRAVGYLTLNSTYTVLRSYFQYTLPEYKLMPNEEALSIIKDMFYSSNEKNIDPNYVFMRERHTANPTKRMNIIIFIMESWTSEYIYSITKDKPLTPFFDSLSQHGVLFTNFLANGQRSIESVPSILSSLPGLFPQSIIGSRVEINKFRGLGSILLEKNYTTSFHHGAASGSMGFDAFIRSAGFMKYYTKSEFSALDDSLYDGVWGVYDEPFFLDALDKINNFNQPFCSVIFSLSPHDPYTIPDYRKEDFKKYEKEVPFERSLRYSDFSLMQFFNYARKQAWFNNTIFLITGDHTLYTARHDMHAAFHVPFLIYAPTILEPKIVSGISSHVDILPTLLDLLDIETVHSSMGVSLLDLTKTRTAMVLFGDRYGIYSDRFVYFNNFENEEGLYDYHSDPLMKVNLIKKFPATADELRKKLFAYIQSVTISINHDLVYRNSE